jgi:cytochrome c-type biogenesis protein CcmE
VIALSVAALLAVFLVYTALAGDTTTQLRPSELAGHTEKVALTGKVAGSIRGDAHSSGGLRFALRDIAGKTSATVPVVFHGTVPDLLRKGRDVVAEGRLRDGTFHATALQTKCPSKYTDAKKST